MVPRVTEVITECRAELGRRQMGWPRVFFPGTLGYLSHLEGVSYIGSYISHNVSLS